MEEPHLQRCAIYTRQSRVTDADLTSCQAQFEAALALIEQKAAHGWRWNGQRYDDLGEGGMDIDRPGLQALLTDVCGGQIDRVVVHRIDRLARRLRDCVMLLQDFRDREVAFTLVSDPQLGQAAEHTFLLGILATFAEFEYEITRERLTEARRLHKAKGRRVAGRVPYGYAAERGTKQLQLHPDEAPRVAQLFAWAQEGKTPAQIAALANEVYWPTKPTPRYPQGGAWTPRQVLATLGNPVYQGRIRSAGKLLPGIHSPVVTGQQFSAVQTLLASRATTGKGRQRYRCQPSLCGILICGQCGRPMSSTYGQRGPRRYNYYRCRSYVGGQPPCAGVSVPAGQIEQFLLERLSEPHDGNDADFHAAWNCLDERQQARALPVILERCELNRREGWLRYALRSDAVERLAAHSL